MQFECWENRMCVTIKFNKRCGFAAAPSGKPLAYRGQDQISGRLRLLNHAGGAC